MEDKERGGSHRQSSDLLERQPDQTVENTNICSHCGRRFSRLWDLRVHERIHTIDKPYRCLECEDSFYTKGKLLRHQLVTHNLQFSLLFPEAELQWVSEQESHPMERTEKGRLTASLLGESREIISLQFENKEAHRGRQERETVIKPNPMRKDALLAHQVLRAVTSCVREMRDREHGGTHRQSSDLLQRQPVQKTKKTYIPLVDQVLSETTTLADQSLSGATSDGREVEERSCDKNMILSTDCLQGNSAEKKKKSYICPLCRKSLSSSSSLGKHIRSHSCSVCKKSFCSKSELSLHKKSHPGEKPHQCLECGKSFQSKWYVDQHRRLHTGEKPYTCSECGKSYSLPSSLNNHVKSHRR